MRRLAPLAALFAAACATAPQRPAPTPQPVAPRESGALVGLGAAEVGARLGQPRLQLREGDGTKLQWTDGRCVLDAYLYPPPSGQGVARVTHVDARDIDGRDIDQARCLAQLEAR